MYERKIDLMDVSVSQQNAHNHFAQKKNPKVDSTTGVKKVQQTNKGIISFVISELADTLPREH
jgi:hypothetical protein